MLPTSLLNLRITLINILLQVFSMTSSGAATLATLALALLG